MHKPSPFLLLGLVAVAGLAFAFAPSPVAEGADTVVTTTASGHTLVIEYVDSRGPYRRAKVSVRSERGARTPWTGRLQGVHLEGLQPLPSADRARLAREGYRQTASFLSSGHTTGSSILAPAPENLKRVWFHGERGRDISFLIPTRGHNPSTRGDGDDDDKEPDAPPPDENPGDGDDDDDGEEREGCPGAGSCVGIINPWTCECEPDPELEDWTQGPSSDGSTTQVSF